MAKTYEQAFVEELARVPWLAGKTGLELAAALGRQQDGEDRALKDAVLMRCPLHAPADGLDLLALDRMILRAPIESDGGLVERLDRAHDIWDAGGAAAAIVDVFKPYGFTSSTVQVLRNCQVSGFWDGNEAWCSRIFVFLDGTAEGAFHTDGTWPEDGGSDLWSEGEDGATWDSTATVADLRHFRSEIRTRKQDGAYPVTIAVWLSGALPDGYWDSPGPVWPEADGDAGGLVWAEDGDCSPLYWTLGHVWGEEVWCGDGPGTDTWAEGEEELSDLPESDQWIAFPGEES